jgi:hypothetical protein
MKQVQLTLKICYEADLSYKGPVLMSSQLKRDGLLVSELDAMKNPK